MEITPDEFHRATEVTYLGYVYGTRSALKRMVPRNQGTVVQVGSALAYRSIPLQSAYCGAKAAIRSFTDSIRTELLHARSDVHLTMVHMPALNTPQFDWCRSRLPRQPQPVPPIYQPEIGAEAIYWAAHHRRREVWVGQSTVAAIAGNKLAPGLLDLVLAVAFAVAKASLIVLFFMHALYEFKLVFAIIGAGVIWLLILIGMTLTDYISRSWLMAPVR